MIRALAGLTADALKTVSRAMRGDGTVIPVNVNYGLPGQVAAQSRQRRVSQGSRANALTPDHRAQSRYNELVAPDTPHAIDLVDIEANWFCYDDQAEILTARRGWVPFADLRDDDEVATLEPTTRAMAWQKPLARPSYDYVGALLHFTSRAVDLLVTPQHRMLVNQLTRKAAKALHVPANQGTGLYFVPASVLAETLSQHVGIPLTADQWQAHDLPPVTVSTGSLRERPITLSGDAYCQVLGLFLSDGSLHKPNGTPAAVYIWQSRTSKRLVAMQHILTAALGDRVRYRPVHGTRQDTGCFVVDSAALAQHFAQFGADRSTHHIPLAVRNANRRQLQLFWDAYMLGEGESTVCTGSTRRYRLSTRQRITTVSRIMADHLQEIAVKMGYSASIRQCDRSTLIGHVVHGATSQASRSAQTVYRVGLRGARHATTLRVTRQPYHGKVYCVSVPANAVYVRRNGKACWSGNSPFQPITPFGPPWIQYPRAWDYPVGVNLNFLPRRIDLFTMLTSLAESWPGLRIVMERRKDQLLRVPWTIQIKQTGKEDDRTKAIRTFLERPDRKQPFDGWLRKQLENLFVTDTANIFIWRSQGTQPYALEVLDGSTIVPLVDDAGRTPDYPNPAYQQLVKGLPMTNLTERDLIYQPWRPRPRLPVYGYCYDANTEVLTRRGWCKFAEVDIQTDEFATRNPRTKEFEWQRATDRYLAPYAGDMYRVHSTSLDLLVTPNHRMLVTSLPRALGGNGKRKGEVLIEAEQLAPYLNHEIKIPMVSAWQGQEIGMRTFRLEGRRADHAGRPIAMAGNDYCALMGMFLSEGNMRTQGGIEITQYRQSPAWEPYRAVLARILRREPTYCRHSFQVPRRGLNHYFEQFGLSHEKFIPDDIMNATPKQIGLFWDYFMMGDGAKTHRHNHSGRGAHPRMRQSITTTSKRMADQLQELAQKLGWSASIYVRPPTPPRLICGKGPYVGKTSYIVRVRHSQAMGFHMERVPYTGTIGCVTVPNGTLYVRRNGYPAWCGNSITEQLVLIAIQGLRRQLYSEKFWTEGSIPDLMVSVPEEWRPEQIAGFQRFFDQLLEGNVHLKSKVRFVPGGMTPFQIKGSAGDLLKSEYDEWLQRHVCFAFSVPPTPFVKETNRATAESTKDQAQEEGLYPLMGYVKSLMDRAIRLGWGYDDVEFTWQFVQETDPTDQMTVLTGYAKAGILTVNEAREQLGMQKIPGGDIARVYIGTGPVPLGSAEAAPSRSPGEAADRAPVTGADPAAMSRAVFGKRAVALPWTAQKKSLGTPRWPAY